METDPSHSFSELFEHRNHVIAALREFGFECSAEYSSIDILHDTHGIEVCGIPVEGDAIEILHMLREMFPTWADGGTYCKEFGCDQGFVATIQRDPEPCSGRWESEDSHPVPFVDHHIYDLPYAEGKSFLVHQGYGGRHSHRGKSFYALDFAMPNNTPVCAIRSGVIVESVDGYGDGGTEWEYKSKANRVAVSHDDGTVATYCHLARNGATARLDQQVRVGEIVGYSGSSGWSGGPHLHLHVSWLDERIPTRFRTVEGEGIQLEEGKRYTRPYGPTKAWRAWLQRLRAKIAHVPMQRR